MSLFGILRKFAVRAQAGTLLMCLVFGSLQGMAVLVSHAPDCCVNGVCPVHRSHKHDDATADCDHGGAKSDCAMKCGMPKVDLAGILPTLPEMIFPDAFASQQLVAARFEAAPLDAVVPQVSFSPPEQPPRS